MDLAAQMLVDAEVGGVFLNTSEHAVQYWYTPLNGLPRQITGVWGLIEPKEDASNGIEIIHTGKMELNSSEKIDRGGIFRIDGVDWPVTQPGEIQVGMRCVTCERRTKVRTDAAGGKYGR